jgi:hypothetical protein
MPDSEPIVPYPDPPAVRSAPILFAALGVVHLVVAVLFGECLQMFNLVIGLIEILIAIWLAVAVSKGRKRYVEGMAKLQARSTPQQPPTGAA